MVSTFVNFIPKEEVAAYRQCDSVVSLCPGLQQSQETRTAKTLNQSDLKVGIFRDVEGYQELRCL